ncbi:MAG: HEAT repeat domain-containing protein [Chitinophagaceae bacterium]|nr:HEAT repeat domain-containing protein [Chitinophagaceae bacterium]
MKRFAIPILCLAIQACKDTAPVDLRIRQFDSVHTARMAASIDSLVKPELADGLTLSVWGVDSLVISPIAIDIDDLGNLYYTTTNRQKNSEFDIRGHQDWEIGSIQLQTIDDKRAFLRRTLSPENSKKNEWLKDLNGDSSHDWKDLTVEKENIYRLSDLNKDGIADVSQLVVDDFNDEVTDVAGGVLSFGDDLYVAVGPDMWRMKDKNNDGIADEKTSISHGYGIHIGFGGHGMSGIEMGPDGRVYWQIGDIGFNGKGPDGQKWEHPNSGVIARSNPDGSDFEIFAYGNRNTHEFVFDEFGNIISEDNDGDHAGEKERLVFIVNGADIGWRSNWQYGKYTDPKNNSYKVWMDEKMYLPTFEGQAAYITPCISNFVSGPAGMVYNPGTALGPQYKNTFFIAEFVGSPSNSGIHEFKLNQKGASFELGEHKKILGGVLPTGLDFGPDGALYLADWIEGWDTHNFGRIWKLDFKDGASQPERQQTKALLAADFKGRNAAQLGELLKNADMRVRQKAQFELVNRGAKSMEVFNQYLKQTTDRLPRVHSIWGICQLARQDKKHAAGLVPYLKDSDAEIRAQVAKWLGDIKYADAGSALIPLLKDTNSRARFFAAEALGRIKHDAAINPLIEFLQVNNDEDAYLRHAGTLALARIGKTAPIVSLANSPSRALRIAAVVTLRRMTDPGIANFLNDKDEFVVTEAARGINDDLSIKDAMPALANLLNTTSFTNEALIRRIINANLRVGSTEALQQLISYAINVSAPAAMRAEAIDALSTWDNPSVVDRVDGRYRGAIQRDAGILKQKVADAFIGLLPNKELAVRLSAVKAIKTLDLRQGASALMTVLKGDKNPAMRSEALSALVAIQDAQITQAIQLALADKEKSVRVTGLNLLAKLPISQDLMVKLLTDVINTRTTEEKQAALITLGRLPLAQSQKPLEGFLDKMSAGKLPPDIYLELGEAVDSTKSAPMITRYKEIAGKLSTDEVSAAYAGALLGGDRERGGRLFFRNQTAQCIRCHSYGDYGGNAGPNLDDVAKRLTRAQILESIINPGARLSPGYGVITLTLKDGKTAAGFLKEETATAYILKGGDGPDQVVQKAEVSKKENAPSSMPDMKPLLSKKEIRDIVSFLAEKK